MSVALKKKKPAKHPAGCAVLLLAVLCMAGCSAKKELPQSAGVVNDFAQVINGEDKARLESLITAVEQQTGAEIAVAAVESYAPYGSIEDYAAALFEHWGPGRTNIDDGVLLILAMKERDVRIEVGYGLEGVLTDAACGRILDENVLPDFREDNFSSGLLRGVEAIAAAIAKDKGVDPAALGLVGDRRQLLAMLPLLYDGAGLITDNADYERIAYDTFGRVWDRTGVRAIAMTASINWTDFADPGAGLERYALGIIKEWGVEWQDEDELALLLIAVDGERLYVLIKSTGVDEALSDAETRRILEEVIVPAVRSGGIPNGLIQGAEAIAADIASARGVDLSVPEPEPGAEAASPEEYETGIGQLVWLLPSFGGFLLIPLIIILSGIISDKRYFKKHGHYPAVRWYKRGGSSVGGHSSGGSRRSGGGRSGGGGSSRHF